VLSQGRRVGYSCWRVKLQLPNSSILIENLKVDKAGQKKFDKK
jgi:hypothetical protein